MSDTSGFQEVRSFLSRSQLPIGSVANNRTTKNLFLAPLSPLAVFCLVVATFLLPVEMWTSLPISVSVAAPPSSSGWDSSTEPCIELNKPMPRPAPLVIGCKLSDCGPGTDGPGSIDLRITLAGELADKTILEFENMTVREATRIVARGNVRHLKGTTRFEVRRGTGVLRGFGTTPHQRPPVATSRLTLNPKILENIKHAAKGENLLTANRYPVTLKIEQFRGPMIINEYSVLNNFRLCPSERPPLRPRKNLSPHSLVLEKKKVDYIDLGTAPLRSLTLAPGRMNDTNYGCSDYGNERYENNAEALVPVKNHLKDEFYLRGKPGLGTLLGALGFSYRCHSEVVVYSESNALAVEHPVTPPWTDDLGDRAPITLPPPLTVPLTAWIIYDSTEEVFSRTYDTLEKIDQYIYDVSEQLREDLTHAQNAFNFDQTKASSSPMCGIQFPDPIINTIDLGRGTQNGTTPSPPFEYAMGRTNDDFTSVASGDAEIRYMSDISPMLYTTKHLNLYLLWGRIDADVIVPAHTASPIACQNTTWSFNCDAYGDMILLSSTDRPPLTIAHEIGHALSLEHTGFNSNNLMDASTSSGGHVTLGQCYRTHVDYSSHLNTEGIRTGPTLRDCPRDSPNTFPGMCPDLALD